MQGARRYYVHIKGDNVHTEVEITGVWLTPLGRTEVEFARTLDLHGNPEPNDVQWLKDELVRIIENL